MLFGIPAACGVAILKYHLYELDVVVRKTVVFTLVAATLTTVYLAVLALATVGRVSGCWSGSSCWPSPSNPSDAGPGHWPTGSSTAGGRRLRGARDLLRQGGRGVLDRRRAPPHGTAVARGGSGAASARVLVRVGGELRQAAVAGERVGTEHVEPVVFQGEDVGALAVSFPVNDPMDAQRQQLIANLASQAGPVVRNVRLIEELRASRQRLVAAQDQERRKIERNLHDGVQQQLVAINVQLGLLARVAEADPAKAVDMATLLQSRATEALEDLRDLAQGIYPPLLADKGLVAALEAQARKAAVPTTVTSDQIERYPQDVESAVYFCVLEALNNVAKYAGATTAVIELAQHDGHLRFLVRDDGAGFDSTATAYGTGLQGMADRLDAIGGVVTVTSAPGAGTTVAGSIDRERSS